MESLSSELSLRLLKVTLHMNVNSCMNVYYAQVIFLNYTREFAILGLAEIQMDLFVLFCTPCALLCALYLLPSLKQ